MNQTAPFLLGQIWQETVTLIGKSKRLSNFAQLPGVTLPYSPVAPARLPVLEHLSGLPALSHKRTRALTQAIVDGKDHLCWQQSYSEDQVGTEYLQNYGWFNIVSPEGPYVAQDFRVSVGLWNKGLSYPVHWHTPEEFYMVLAGGARFSAKGRAPRQVAAGGLVHHRSNQPHGMEMVEFPLLAIAVWRGDGLMAISELESDNALHS